MASHTAPAFHSTKLSWSGQCNACDARHKLSAVLMSGLLKVISCMALRPMQAADGPIVAQVTELNVTTPSTVPPSFTVTAVGNYTEGNAILTVATNETATVYYMVLLGQATTIPTAAQVCEPAVLELFLLICVSMLCESITDDWLMQLPAQSLPASYPAKSPIMQQSQGHVGGAECFVGCLA